MVVQKVSLFTVW